MMLFWLLALIGLGALAAWLAQQRMPQQSGEGGRPQALDILRRRYASGEITREQYEQMRQELER